MTSAEAKNGTVNRKQLEEFRDAIDAVWSAWTTMTSQARRLLRTGDSGRDSGIGRVVASTGPSFLQATKDLQTLRNTVDSELYFYDDLQRIPVDQRSKWIQDQIAQLSAELSQPSAASAKLSPPPSSEASAKLSLSSSAKLSQASEQSSEASAKLSLSSEASAAKGAESNADQPATGRL